MTDPNEWEEKWHDHINQVQQRMKLSIPSAEQAERVDELAEELKTIVTITAAELKQNDE